RVEFQDTSGGISKMIGLQALGNFYAAFGELLGGGRAAQQASESCHKHDHKQDVEKRLSELEKGIQFKQWQPTNSVTVMNNNTLISR
ncbi:hypothetical protein AO262_36160, partial [Pseudomonas fluorescens ABAC62]